MGVPMSLATEFLGVAKNCLTHTCRFHFDPVTLYYKELLDFAITSHTKQSQMTVTFDFFHRDAKVALDAHSFFFLH
jgi:hypothetical protein